MTVTRLDKFPSFLWYSKVLNHDHNSPSSVTVLSHTDPVHTLPTEFLTSILILSSHYHIFRSVLFLKILHQNVYTFLIFPVHSTFPANLILLDLFSVVIFGEEQELRVVSHHADFSKKSVLRKSFVPEMMT